MTDVLDATLRYHVRLDGLARSTLRTMAGDISAALRQVEREIRRRQPDEAPFTYARLTAVRSELVSLHTALRDRLSGTVRDVQTAIAETSIPASRAALTAHFDGLDADNAGRIVASFVDVPTAVIAASIDVPHDGRRWTAWGVKLADDTVSRLESELRQAASLGEPMPAIGRRVRKVTGLARRGAERLARTMVNDVGNRARIQATKAIGRDVLRGWRYTATLDSKTSVICAGLDGREFGIDDPSLPFPPRHVNCRSVIAPVVKSFSELGIDAPEIPEGTRPAVTGATATQVSAGTSYAQWFRRQPAGFQREVLGDARYRAYRGGVPLEQMATPDRELKISELKRIYPRETSGV